jgi:hypothetical protein
VDAILVFHRFQEQLVGFLALVVGNDEVGRIEKERIDLGLFDERENFHGSGGFGRDFLYFFGVDQHIFSVFVFVAFHHFRAVHNPVAGRAK